MLKRIVVPGPIVCECDNFDYYVVTTHKYGVIKSRDIIDDVTDRRAVETLSYRVPIGHEPLNRLVSDSYHQTFRHTDRQTRRMLTGVAYS